MFGTEIKMNRIEIYDYLCANPRGSGGLTGVIKRNFPKLYANLCANLNRDLFDKPELYCFLHRMQHPKCANAACSERAQFGYRLQDGFALFCEGHRCNLPFELPNYTKQPAYAKLVISKIRRELRNSGNVAHWLRGNLDKHISQDIILSIGYTFKPKQLYDFLFPRSRKTCCAPGCTKAVSFDSRKWRYRRYCCTSCIWKDPAVLEKRNANYLAKTNGKYSSPTQNPEINARQVTTRRATELLLSNGTRTHHNQRPGAGAKIGASAIANELVRSGGTRMHHMQRDDVIATMTKIRNSDAYQEHRREIQLAKSAGKYTHPMQRPDVSRRVASTAGKSYDVEFKGKVWCLQGYEDSALYRLIADGKIPPSVIQVNKRSFKYAQVKDSNSFRRYTPDLAVHIPKKKFYVEVKGTNIRFGGLNTKTNKMPKATLNKLRAVVAAGETIILLVVTRSGSNGKRGGSPRKGKLSHYIVASPKKPHFELRTDFEWLYRLFAKLMKA
jgi:hypothetical protein